MNVVLTVNAGSSSLKFGVFAADSTEIFPPAIFRGKLEMTAGKIHCKITDTPNRIIEDGVLSNASSAPAHHAMLNVLLDWIDAHRENYRLSAVGHRIVHGGDYSVPLCINENLMRELESLTPLAPLHQPVNLSPIKVLQGLYPALPQVACFDTSFHRHQPLAAQQFALPQEFFDRGIKRYGFHGLSCEYINHVLPQYTQGQVSKRVIVAHLGNGASMCAIKYGKSIASTMSFTALDGLPMGTRCGQLDPGVVLYLIDELGMSSAEISDLLYHQSGLLGLSGVSSDMRELLASEKPAAESAIDYFAYRIARELGSLASALEGLDLLVFTGGIGENAALLRAKACKLSGWLGIEIDHSANNSNIVTISNAQSKVTVLVIPTDEEAMIAHHTRQNIFAVNNPVS